MSTPDTFALLAGAILSLGLSYIPGLNVKYAALDGITKRGINAILMVVAALGIIALSCSNVLKGLLPDNTAITCAAPDILAYLRTLALAFIANQTTFMATPAANAVQGVLDQKAAVKAALAKTDQAG